MVDVIECVLLKDKVGFKGRDRTVPQILGI